MLRINWVIFVCSLGFCFLALRTSTRSTGLYSDNTYSHITLSKRQDLLQVNTDELLSLGILIMPGNRTGTSSEWPIFATKTRLSLSTPMPPRNQDQSFYKEGQLLLAISAINRGQIKNVHQAAKIYNVPERTLRRRDCRANSTKLTNSGRRLLFNTYLSCILVDLGLLFKQQQIWLII
jgi:hypothetical protein